MSTKPIKSRLEEISMNREQQKRELHDFIELSKFHLNPELKDKFIFNKDILSKEEEKTILEHLISCELCTKELAQIQREKRLYEGHNLSFE